MKIVLYVLRGRTNSRRYVGITNDLPRRLSEHRSRRSKGGQMLGEFTLLHTEEFDSYSAARKREIFLKSGQGRLWLERNLVSDVDRAQLPPSSPELDNGV